MLPDSSANDSGIGKSAETSELATLDQSLLLPPTLSPEDSPGATCLSVEIDGQRESPLHIEETPGPSHENARTPQSPIIPAALSSFKLQLRPISEASPNSLDPIEPQPDALKQKGGGTADWINLPSGSNSSLPPSADQLELEVRTKLLIFSFLVFRLVCQTYCLPLAQVICICLVQDCQGQVQPNRN